MTVPTGQLCVTMRTVPAHRGPRTGDSSHGTRRGRPCGGRPAQRDPAAAAPSSASVADPAAAPPSALSAAA